jgi:hypothetical protein
MSNIHNIVEEILVPHTAFEAALNRLEQCFKRAEGASEPICIAVLGESRTGKSRAIEEFCRRHPRYRNQDGLTIPIVRVRTPPKPTVKGMAELMLSTIGEKYDAKGTEIKKTEQIIHLLKTCQTRAIVIEEFNHFVDSGNGKVAFHASDWLKELADSRNIMLCVSGLESCRAVISRNEQLAGRFSRPIVMPRFDWTKPRDREEFIAILSSFESLLERHFDMPSLSSTEMAFRIYCATGGLIGYVAKLFSELVWLATYDGRTVIRMHHFLEAGEQAIWSGIDTDMGVSAFDSSFSLDASDELLERIRTIGQRDELYQPSKVKRPRGMKPKLDDVLAARSKQ